MDEGFDVSMTGNVPTANKLQFYQCALIIQVASLASATPSVPPLALVTEACVVALSECRFVEHVVRVLCARVHGAKDWSTWSRYEILRRWKGYALVE